MAWIDIKKDTSKEIHRVTEEAYELIFKEQGFKIVNSDKPENNVSTAKNITDDKFIDPKSETPFKRQYTKRNSVFDKQ